MSLATAGADESITVLSWNTQGEEPGVDAIVKLALESGADIVALPETTDELGTEVAIAMKEGGRPMWVLDAQLQRRTTRRARRRC